MAKREVPVQLPDGTVVILEDVPDSVSDEQAKAYVGEQKGMTPETGGQTSLRRARELGAAAVTGPARAVSGIGDLALMAKDALKGDSTSPRASAFDMLMDKYRSLGLSPKINALRDQMAGRPLEGDIPTTVAQGAAGGLLFPGGPLVNAAAGGVSAGASEAAAQAGMPPAAQIGLGLAGGVGTGILAGGVRNAWIPQTARKHVDKSLENMTMRQRLQAALEGMDPEKMAWQSAPEGTELRTLGQKAAMSPEGTKIQAQLQRQRDLPQLGDDTAVQDDIKRLAGKHATLNPKSEVLSAISRLTAVIGSPAYRMWQAYKGEVPFQTSREYDKLLSLSLEELVAEMRKGRKSQFAGIVPAASSGAAPALDVPQNE